jgi:4-hydroxy-tetrahydrodipicolinate synthase
MITGSIVALATPMTDSGDVDWSALEKLVEMHIEKGTSSIVAMGTSGESATLNDKEHLKVIGEVVKQVNGRIPVIAGTGANSTSEAIHLTQEAQRLGVDAVLLVTPYYNKPTQEGLFLHHKAIAEAASVDQILYNVPGRTACDMLPETVERLADFKNIVGIKEATGDIDRAKDVIARVGGRMAVYSGDDETAYKLILAGGQGNISVTANIAPAEMAELCALALGGKAEEAEAMNNKLMVLHNAMFVESNPIPVKWAMHEMDLCGPGIRLPLTPLAEEFREPLRSALRQWNLIK